MIQEDFIFLIQIYLDPDAIINRPRERSTSLRTATGFDDAVDVIEIVPAFGNPHNHASAHRCAASRFIIVCLLSVGINYVCN